MTKSYRMETGRSPAGGEVRTRQEQSNADRGRRRRLSPQGSRPRHTQAGRALIAL